MRFLSIFTVALLAFGFQSCDSAEALSSPEAMVTKVKDLFGKIGSSVDSVKDADSAKKANTSITDLVGKVSGVMDLAKKLPSGTGSKVLDLVKGQAGPLLTKLTALAPNLKEHLGGAISKLTSLTK